MENEKEKENEIENKQEIEREVVLVPDIVDSFYKPEPFITAKYRASIDTQKVLDAALFKFQEKQYSINEYGQVVIEMTAPEIKEIILSKSNSLSIRLSGIANQLTDIKMWNYNEDKTSFNVMVILDYAEYVDGTFKVFFNPLMQKYMNITDNRSYTQYNRGIVMRFKKVYTYRIYQLLKNRMYYPKNYGGVKTNCFEIIFDYYELRLLLGVTNSNLSEVSKVLQNTYPPDYKKACEASPEKIFPEWYEFRRNVLNPAVKEINESPISDIFIELKTIRGSKHEVKYVGFIAKKKDKPAIEVNLKESIKKARVVSDEEKFELTTRAFQLFSIFKLSYGDVQTILEALEFDEKILEAVADYIRDYKERNDIDRPVGFALECIKNKWYLANMESVVTEEESSGEEESNSTPKKTRTPRKKKNSFTDDVPAGQYNFDDFD